ncbi:MAG: DNA repair and recombination protein RadB [Candidatus Woesearchaeota archaeon]|nr:MAG: DNA repair and recombination protein RadB [Candidatus Woesearchaeota archaeon]
MALNHKKVSSGSKVLDELLNGGYESGIITTIYGASGTGKSNIGILSAVNLARQGKKVVYIDSEGSFSKDRAHQIEEDYEKIIDNIIFLKPTSFQEQIEAVNEVKEIVNAESRIGMIIIDSIALLYRLELGEKEDALKTNRAMARLLRTLAEIARKKELPILVMNQVYADFQKKQDVKMVGGDLLKYWSKCIVKLESIDAIKKATVVKHRSIPSGKAAYFEIRNKGLRKVEQV